jgi:putative DNA primase/helicase
MSDLNIKALSKIQDILFHLFPAGRIHGFEFKIGGFDGEKGDSLSINMRTGVWSEFNGGAKGGNIMGIVEHTKKMTYPDACKWVEDFIGEKGDVNQQAVVQREDIKFIIPAIERPTDFTHPKSGIPKNIYEYCNQRNEIVNFICRFEPANGKKFFIPYSLTTEGWMWKQIPENRTIYGEEKLQNPTQQIIVCEGEKACNTLQQMLPSCAVISWSGGAQAVGKTNWSPLSNYEKIAIWPDNDEPGVEAAKQIADILIKLNVKRITIANIPEGFPKGWDAADAVNDGIDIPTFLKENLREIKSYTYHEPQSQLVAPIPANNMPEEIPIENTDDPYIPLGHNHGEFFYYSHLAKQVIKLATGAHTKLQLFSLATENYWQMTYPTGKGNSSFSVDSAASSLMHQCYRKGIYDVTKVRGRGAWWDEGRMVFHLGNQMLVDGVMRDIFIDSDYVYEMGGSIGAPDNDPLSGDDLKAYVDLAKMFNWRDPLSAYFLLGWCVVAPLCGILRWRPHIWITGAKGSGKSWIMENFMRGSLGDIGLAYLSVTTAAGIRGDIQREARPVIFDEAEGEDIQARQRMQDILDLMRQASSRTSAVIAKGTAFGGSMQFQVQSCFALSSIGDSLKHGADESRVTVLSLHSAEGKSDSDAIFDKIKEKAVIIDHRFSRRLFARTMKLIDVIQDNAEMFSKAGAKVMGSKRAGDQIGTLLAGAYSLHSDERLSLEKATKWLVDRKFAENFTPAIVEGRCYEKIMQIVVTVPTDKKPIERSIGELVQTLVTMLPDEEISFAMIQEFLSRRGIRVDNGDVLIANTHSMLAKMLESTPWALNWGKILQQMPGTDNYDSKIVSFVGGVRSRVTRIITSSPPV